MIWVLLQSELPWQRNNAIVSKFHMHVHILQKEINLHQKELSITFGRNIRNMLIIGLCHR